MEARVVEHLPTGGGWQFEPKWDGFRCLAFRDHSDVELIAKSGKSLSRYFPEIIDLLRHLPCRTFVLDGELVVPVASSLSFDALQARLHPAASRIRKLAFETPARYILFDFLARQSDLTLWEKPLRRRREKLEAFFAKIKVSGRLHLTPYTEDRVTAQHWLDYSGGALDGVVIKDLTAPYCSGLRAMMKIKRMRTADCVIGGFRYATHSRQVGSLLLGLYDGAGRLNHVGFTSGIPDSRRAALTRQLEMLIGSPGFTGDTPGAPSRWSTERSVRWTPLLPRLVAEVQYDHVTGNRFRHGTRLLRWRPDKDPHQCTYSQLQSEARPCKLISKLFALS
jgi:ATP-dependent DNA ligase